MRFNNIGKNTHIQFHDLHGIHTGKKVRNYNSFSIEKYYVEVVGVFYFNHLTYIRLSYRLSVFCWLETLSGIIRKDNFSGKVLKHTGLNGF